MMEEKPIYDFNELRQFLVRLGYIVEQAQGYKEIRPEVIDPMVEIRRGTMEFRGDGIFVIDPETGKEQLVFVYKYDYWLHRYGEQIPRFHICRCIVIDDFMNRGAFDGHYVRANTDPVPVLSKETHRKVEISGLPLCKYCLDKISEYGRINSAEFVELLKQARGADKELEIKEVDIFGYTRDWDEVSRIYREKHDYTCERCGLKITDIFDRQYMHCHHKDKNKLNNRDYNLECLCMRCHSKVDSYHLKNLTTGANRIIMSDFNRKYLDPEGIDKLINRCNLNAFDDEETVPGED